MLKILTILGARPQFIKAAALSRAFPAYPGITEVIVHTGQHFDTNMSDIFFREMEIPQPAYFLNINGKGHGAMTGNMLEKIEEVALAEKPGAVMVYGDTNSTLAGALAASKLHIPVIHVEAGLRSFNMKMPEEINRILTDRVSTLLFCPTAAAVSNLEKEGFNNFPCRIIRSGDVMEDAALYYSRASAEHSQVMKNMKLEKGGFILCTIHRAENTDNPATLSQILRAIDEVCNTMPVVLPLHPRTRNIMKQHQLGTRATLIDPVGYFDMIELLKNCAMVMTDSGGLQKEAFFFSRFCVTLREQTEWTELVENGYNRIAGSDPALITKAAHELLQLPFPGKKNLYGNGNASAEIAREIDQYFNG